MEALKEELAQERQEREERLAYGGLKALGEEERLNYEAQLQLEQDMAKQKVEIDQLPAHPEALLSLSVSVLIFYCNNVMHW